MSDYDDEREPIENVALGLFAIARAIDRLGTANAATPMGAIEILAMEIKNGLARMGDGLDQVAEKLSDGLDDIAAACATKDE